MIGARLTAYMEKIHLKTLVLLLFCVVKPRKYKGSLMGLSQIVPRSHMAGKTCYLIHIT